MKRKLATYVTCLMLLFSIMVVANVGAHPVTVGDSSRQEWFALGPTAINQGSIARDSASRGEFVWTDVKGDQRIPNLAGSTGQITPEVDLMKFNVTADANNVYFMAKMDRITGANNNPPVQLMISVDTDHSPSDTNLQLPDTVGISVTNEAAWDYVIETRFTSVDSNAVPRLYRDSSASTTCTGCAAQRVTTAVPNGNFVEIKIPWDQFSGTAGGVKPPLSAFWRFTVSTYYADHRIPVGNPPGVAVADVLSNAPTTLDEISDRDIDTFFDLRFDAAGEVFSPLLVTEFLPYPTYGGAGADPAGEWIELYNTLPSSCGAACNLNLLGYKIGNQPNRGASTGAMLTLPNYTLAPGSFAVIVNDENRFRNHYPLVPVGAIINESTMHPYTPTYTGTQWAPSSTLSLSRRKLVGGVLTDFKESVALLDHGDTLTDIVQYGTTGATLYEKDNSPIFVPLTGVTADESFERCPPDRDTNNASFDFVVHDPAAGGTPTPAAPCPPPAGIDLQITKTATASVVLRGDTITYILKWDNAGQGSVSNVVVTDTLPVEINFVDASPPPSTTVGQQLTWNLGPAGTGVNGTIILTTTLSNSAPGGREFVNTAGVKSGDSSQVDANPDDNFDSASVMATIPDLSVSSSGWPAQAEPDKVFCYDINYNYSNGINTATNVIISDALPAGLSLVSQSSTPPLPFNGASHGTLAWGPGTIPVDGSGSIHVCVKVDDTVRSGPAATNNVITITGSPDLDTSPGSNNVESRPLTFGLHKIYLPILIK